MTPRRSRRTPTTQIAALVPFMDAIGGDPGDYWSRAAKRDSTAKTSAYCVAADWRFFRRLSSEWAMLLVCLRSIMCVIRGRVGGTLKQALRVCQCQELGIPSTPGIDPVIAAYTLCVSVDTAHPEPRPIRPLTLVSLPTPHAITAESEIKASQS